MYINNVYHHDRGMTTGLVTAGDMWLRPRSILCNVISFRTPQLILGISLIKKKISWRFNLLLYITVIHCTKFTHALPSINAFTFGPRVHSFISDRELVLALYLLNDSYRTVMRVISIE